MSLSRLCLGEMVIQDNQTWNSQYRQEVSIRTYVNSIIISEINEKSCNQEHSALTFPNPPMPGRNARSRPSEFEITVPSPDKRKIEEGPKPAHIWIRHSFRKIFQRPSISLASKIQTSFRHHYTPKTHTMKVETRMPKDKKITALKKYSKKTIGPFIPNLESNKIVKYDKPRRKNKADKVPSKSSYENEIFKKPKPKSETNLESKESNIATQTGTIKDKKDSKNFKNTIIESIYAKKNSKKYSKNSKRNSDDKSKTCSIIPSNVDLMMCLEESIAGSMDMDTWLKNFSQNNSKKPAKKDAKKDTKKDAKKGSDGESADSKDAKKDLKKEGKSMKRKGSKKDADSTDAESGDSKDAKKDGKKDKASKKDDKKKDAKKDADSTDAESGDSKDAKKSKKPSKKDDKKKDAKKEAVSTESESEVEAKKSKKDDKKDKKDSKKKSMKKDTGSTDADSESEGDAKKGKKEKKDSKKDSKKKDAKKSAESTESESEVEAKKGKKQSLKGKKPSKEGKKDSKKDAKKDTESEAESDKSQGKAQAKKKTDDSDATSTDSRKGVLEPKRGLRMSSKKTTFKEKEKIQTTGRIPPSRERPPLPPCEPILPSPKIKRLCRCKMPPPPPKKRYAPLPEAEWIRKLL